MSVGGYLLLLLPLLFAPPVYGLVARLGNRRGRRGSE